MTTLQQVELVCPVCDTRFRSQTVLSTNTFGGKRTDFQEYAIGIQSLPYLIHTCLRCGFTGDGDDFDGEVDIPSELRDRVLDELAPAMQCDTICGSEKFELAAKIAGWRGYCNHHIAYLFLQAAWCCVNEGDVEAERYFRRKAAWKYEEALAEFDGISPRSERASVTYLVGELWRRVGDVKQATFWFNRVSGEIIDLASQAWIVKHAVQQRDYPREWFS